MQISYSTDKKSGGDSEVGPGRDKSPPLSSSTFNNITLSLPRVSLVLTHSSVSLETLLQMYVSRESVSSGDGGSGDASSKGIVKQLTFGRLPHCLCLHVQRTAMEMGRPSKRNDHVAFPDLLDMSRYAYASQAVKTQELEKKSREWAAKATGAVDTEVKEKKNNDEADKEKEEGSEKGEIKLPPLPLGPDRPRVRYKLRSVVVHLGAINSGHYLTYRKGPTGGKMSDKWFLTSDEKVEEVDDVQVKSSNAYMLFYEREEPAMRVMSPD